MGKQDGLDEQSPEQTPVATMSFTDMWLPGLRARLSILNDAIRDINIYMQVEGLTVPSNWGPCPCMTCSGYCACGKPGHHANVTDLRAADPDTNNKGTNTSQSSAQGKE